MAFISRTISPTPATRETWLSSRGAVTSRACLSAFEYRRAGTPGQKAAMAAPLNKNTRPAWAELTIEQEQQIMEYFSGFSRADLEKYSLQRAIRSLAQKRPLEGIERDVSRELAKRSGKPTAGIHIPLTIPTGPDLERGALDLTTGAGPVATTVDPARFIDALRSRTVCLAAGATIITGLVGNLQLPRESVIATPA